MAQTLGLDTFARVNQSGWGTATDGNTWAQQLGTATPSILSNQGKLTGATTSNKLILGSATAQSIEALVRVKATASSDVVGLALKSIASNTYYSIGVVGGTNLRLAKTISGTFTQIKSPAITYTAGNEYWIRARCVWDGTNNTFYARIWQDGTSEPSTWNINGAADSAVDSAISTAGSAGVIATLGVSTDSAFFDNFTAYNGILQTHDYAMRARLGLARDFAFRARLQAGNTATRDYRMRARLAGPQTRDFAFRAGLFAPPPGQLGSDNFTRANQSGWGQASDGQNWAQIDGNQAASIVSNAGQITAGQGSAVFVLGSQQAQDVDLKMLGSVSASTSRHGVLGRVQNATTLYRIYWKNGNLIIERLLADTPSQLASTSFAETLGNTYYIRAQIYGNSPTTIKAKIWASSDSEPSTWTLTATDNNPITGAGLHGIYLYTNANTDTATASNYAAYNLTYPRDFAFRARLVGQGTADFAFRAGLGGLPASRDYRMRARLAGLGQRDFAFRAALDAALTPLPAPVAGSLAATIGWTTVPIQEGSFSTSETVTGRSSCQFNVEDPTGALHIRYRERVVIAHSVRGVIFRGFVNTVQEENLPPNAANILQIVCIDEHWEADKRIYEGAEFNDQTAGTVATFLAKELAADGVTAGYAIDHDTSTADFAEGTLSNTIAAANIGATSIGDGDLELAPAGSTLSLLSTPATPQPTKALHLSGYASVPNATDLYHYRKIWSGNYVIHVQDGVEYDALLYDIWISSTCPDIKAGIDLGFSDGTWLRTQANPGTDQFGLSPSPATDLTNRAVNKWYRRNIGFPASLNGKTITSVALALEGDKVGQYDVYVRNIYIGDNITGAAHIVFFADSLSQNPSVQVRSSGYINTALEVVDVYDGVTTITDGPYPLDQVGIVNSSFLSYSATGISDTATIDVGASLDGNSFIPCSNNAAIPALPPGMNAAGRALTVQYIYKNTGPDPRQIATVSGAEYTVTPSFAAQKIDLYQSISALPDFMAVVAQQNTQVGGATDSTGRYGNGLTLYGSWRTFDNGDQSNQWLAAGYYALLNGYQYLEAGGGLGSFALVRLDWIPQLADFTFEANIQIDASGPAGLVYRTNSNAFRTPDDTYAYCVNLSPTAINLDRGNNSSSGAGAKTNLATAALTLNSGDWHRLKVVVSGSLHTVYLDDAQYLQITDSTYTSAGSFGLHYANTSGTDTKIYYDAVGAVSGLIGTATWAPVDLSAAGVCGNSLIAWEADTPDTTSAGVEISLDGGISWQECTNGGPIPDLSPGLSLTNTNIQVRATLTAGNATLQPVLWGINWLVSGQLQASGYRISPPLALGPVGRVGSGTVAWDATLPNDSTTIGIDVSLDGATWTDITSTSGQQIADGASSASIPLLVGQQDTPPFIDIFTEDDSASYVNSSLATGAGSLPATWAVDTTNSRITATGGHDGYLAAPVTIGDGEIIFDADWCDNGGVMWAMDTLGTTCYVLQVQDSQAGGSPNRMRLFKVVYGIAGQLGNTYTLDFPRGVPTRFKITQIDGIITVTVHLAERLPDGAVVGGLVQTMTYTDSAPLAPGAVALRASGGTNRYYQLRAQGYGDDVTQATLYTRVRLATTDPQNSPQIQQLTVAVHDPNISDGAIIPQTTYSTLSGSTNTIAQDLDDLAKQSSTADTYWWGIDNGALFFLPQSAMPAPWIATNNDMLYGARVQVTYDNDLYRNEAVIIGGQSTATTPETFIANGFRTGFNTSQPIDSIDSILVNGQAASFGIAGVDVGKDFYFQVGQTGITQDATAGALPAGTRVDVTYEAQITIVAKARNEGHIAFLGSIDGTSGVVSVVEKVDGLNQAGALALAQARLAQYCKFGLTLAFTTARPGLRKGQLLTVFLPQHGLINSQFLVTQVDYTPVTAVINGQITTYEQFKIQATSGPVVGDWTRLFA